MANHSEYLVFTERNTLQLKKKSMLGMKSIAIIRVYHCSGNIYIIANYGNVSVMLRNGSLYIVLLGTDLTTSHSQKMVLH